MIRLFIDDIEAELPRGTELAITKQVATVFNLENRQVDFTNRFILPKTPRNIRLMQQLGINGNQSDRPYKFASARLEYNTIVYADRLKAIVSNVTAQGFEVNLLGSQFDFAERLKLLQLNELEVDGTTHTLTAEFYRDSQNDTSGVTYPAIEMTLQENGRTVYFADTTYPALFVKQLFEKLVLENFNGLIGDWAFSQLHANDLILCTNVQGQPWKDFERVKLTLTTDFVTTPSSPLPTFYWLFFSIDENQKGWADNVLVLSPALTQLVFTTNRKIRVSVKGRLTAVAAAIRLRIRTKPTSQGTPDVADTILAESELASGTLTTDVVLIDGEFEVSVEGGNDIYLSVDYSFIGSLTGQTARLEDCEVTFEFLENRLFDDTFNPSLYLPELSQWDFFREVVRSYGLVFAETPDGFLRAESFADIFAGAFGIDNWTRKFIREESENYKYGDYGVESFFQYNGERLEGADFNGWYLKEFDNDNYDDQKEVVKLAAAGLSNTIRGFLNVGGFTDDDGTIYLKGDGNINLALRNYDPSPVGRRAIFLRQGLENTTLTLTSGLNIAQRRDLEQFVLQFYGDLLTSIERPVVKTVDIFLTEAEFYNLDFFKLKYFEQYQAYFYLIKAENYMPGKPLKVQLLKVKRS